MQRSLVNSRVIVTGASSGIGQAIAEEAVKAGARVAVTARSTDKLEAFAKSMEGKGHPVLVITADVTNQGDRERMIETVVDQWGGLDVLINNAGVGSFAHFVESNSVILRKIMELNFFAPAELIRLAIPHLRKGNSPAIVNLTSMCGRRGIPAWTEYSASKFALVGLTEALYGEMARFDIDVVHIVPGLTASDLRGHLLLDKGKMKIDFKKSGMKPSYVGEKVIDALKKGKREIVLGWEARWILFGNRWAPRFANWMLARKVRKLYAS